MDLGAMAMEMEVATVIVSTGIVSTAVFIKDRTLMRVGNHLVIVSSRVVVIVVDWCGINRD